MDVSLKDREDALWTQYAESGTLPAVPELVTPADVAAAHESLSGGYNQLLKLLHGEALARKGTLNDEERSSHVEAARWVWRIVNSSKRNYSKKIQMSASLAEFRQKSRNARLALVAGLEKGAQMLREMPEAGKLVLADKLLTRLVAVSGGEPGVSEAEEFIRLAISVGWVFSKQNKAVELRQVIDLLPREPYFLDEYFRTNIERLKDRLRFVDEEPVRNWFKDAKAAEESGSGPEVWALDLLNRAIRLVGAGRWFERIRSENSFDIRRMLLLKVTRMVGRYKNGMPTFCASAYLKILEKDGLKNLSSEYFERRKKDLKPGEQLSPHVKPEWPSLAEDLAKRIVSAGKACWGKRHAAGDDKPPDLEWAIEFMENVYRKFTDDEWADYRLGKLFVWSGNRDRGRERVLPVVRKKHAEYWAWDLLGDLMPEKRLCCVARALACNADEIYTKALKQEAAQIGLEVLSAEERARLIAEADDLLVSGLQAHRGILIEKFKTQEGKRRLVFSVGDGTDIMPVSPKLMNQGDMHVGMPVDLYWEGEPLKSGHLSIFARKAKPEAIRLIAVKPRLSGCDWDVIKPERAVYLDSFKEKSGSVAGIYADEKGMEFLSRVNSGRFAVGDEVSVYYKDVVKEDRPRECVQIVAAGEGKESGFLLLPRADFVYYGLSQKGTSYLFSSGVVEINVPIGKFSDVGLPSVGDAFRMYYSKRLCEDKESHERKKLLNVRRVERIKAAPQAVKSFAGRVRLPRGLDGPGFVDDVLISNDLYMPVLDENGKDDAELFVEGTAVLLPPKSKVDRYGIQHIESRARAIELHRIDDHETIERIQAEEALAEEERESLRKKREREREEREQEREEREYHRSRRHYYGRGW